MTQKNLLFVFYLGKDERVQSLYEGTFRCNRGGWKGLGKKLIEHSIQIAKTMGYTAILTLGYPYHYEPYGFVGGKRYNISMEDGKFYKGLLALPLYEGALDNVSGYAVLSEILEVTDE